MNRTKRIATLAVASCLVIASCGSDDAETEPTPATQAPATTDAPAEEAEPEPVATDAPVEEPAPDTTAAPETTVPAVFPRTVEHALGTTDVAAEPMRVVSLDRSLTDPVLALGLDLVGYTTYQDPDGELPAYFGDALVDHAADAEWVGDLLSPNLEAILAVQPDLIVSSKVRHEAIYAELSQIAPTVMSESGGGGWKDNVRLVGEATGREATAEAVLSEYEARAAEIGAAINDVADSPTISVVRFLGEIRLYQPVSFSGTVLEDAGLARPESQQDREDFILQISEEELQLADADHLFFTVYDNEDAEAAFAELEARPLWQTLAAVQNGNAHPVVDDRWMSGVGVFGAHAILDDLAATFGVE